MSEENKPHNTIASTLKLKLKVRDPIYGFIELTENEIKLIDLPIFQRLRRISQLALTKYVYPSAEHSRFVHSLGVMQCASLIFESCMGGTVLPREKFTKHIKILRYAALLHDIGHLPFSHATEGVFLQEGTISHEDISKHITISTKEIKEIIEADFNDKDVVGVIAEMFVKNPIIRSEYNIVKMIISGMIDADRADYLLRDSYMCGVDYGKYDFQRYKDILKYDPDENDIYINERDIFIIESLLLAKYHYYLQVPFHRTRLGYNIVVEQYFKENKNDFSDFFNVESPISKVEDINYDKFIFFDDYTAIEVAKNKCEKEKGNWSPYLLRFKTLTPIFNALISKSQKYRGEYHTKLINKLTDLGYKENIDFFIHDKDCKVISDKDMEKYDLKVKSSEYYKSSDTNMTRFSTYSSVFLDNVIYIKCIYVLEDKAENIKKELVISNGVETK